MLRGHKQNLVCTTSEGRDQWPLQETEPDLPWGVWVSLVGAQVSSDLPPGQGLWLQQTWAVWHGAWVLVEEVAITPHHRADKPQTGEHLYQRSSHTVTKILGSTTDFPTWGSSQRTENPQGNRLFKGTTKPCVHQVPRERNSDPTRDWAKLAFEYLGVSGGGVGQQWPATGSGALTTAVLGTVVRWHKSFWRRSPWPPVPLP